MADTMENMVELSYFYYRGRENPVSGVVEVSERMQFVSPIVQHFVALQIAEKLKAKGLDVWRDGQPIMGGVEIINKSSYERIDVDCESCDSFILECYGLGAPICPGAQER